MESKAENVAVTRGGESKGAAASRAYPPLAGLRDEFDRLFDHFLDRGWLAPYAGLRSLWEPARFEKAGFAFPELVERPRADMSESDEEYELTVELPGMSEKDIEVTITDDVISLKGEKKSEREIKEKDYYLAERSYGSVRRSFSMPAGVDADKVKASFSKGVLTLKLPKTEVARAKPRKVSIKAE